jgi:hypothetical protein
LAVSLKDTVIFVENMVIKGQNSKKLSNQQQESKRDYGKFAKDDEKKFDDTCKNCKKGHIISDCRKWIANEQR